MTAHVRDAKPTDSKKLELAIALRRNGYRYEYVSWKSGLTVRFLKANLKWHLPSNFHAWLPNPPDCVPFEYEQDGKRKYNNR